MLGHDGLIQIYTGNGKGKTTAALGLVLRACGQGAKIAVIQFMKGWEHYGELSAVKLLPNVTFVQTGRPDYVYRGKEEPKDFQEAERGLALASEVASSGEYDLLILDEINVALDYKLIPLGGVLDILRSKPKSLELVLTGRNAPRELIEEADLVTEMKEIKHPYQKGLQGRRGIEY